MSTNQPSLREIIAGNIRMCRLKKFPGRGGAKKCAEAFSLYIGQNISQQQWSPWECGTRMPNESHLQEIAEFFGKPLEYMFRDNQPSAPAIPAAPHYEPPESSYAGMSAPELVMAMGQSRMKAVYQVEISVASVRFVPCNELLEK